MEERDSDMLKKEAVTCGRNKQRYVEEISSDM